MRFHRFLHYIADIFGNLLGIAITVLGLAFHLQLDTFNFLRFAVNQLASGFLYLACDVFSLAFDLVFVYEITL